ncbi:inositol 2-dehydrogenase [Halalkalibacterium halodurans]|uniref:inositol 2-dehydrogenase n=1 Tax=Halalkalibacterium halodurans TaxID=86665 RepID=UPI00106867C1|nr:inositol 2-dehydrogenase [Halalkalibacterium halodurans]MED4173707.1 inositol 2-dehydrogenase [Halalkalibacterium halodurans]TES57519.1 inositol 2-dehydrogenase [Halalkalibacterium halodurans]
MKTVNIGLIGAGRIGQLHARNIISSPYMELKAVSDVQLDHLKGTEIERSVEIMTTNPDELFSNRDIDAIFICSSTDTHAAFIKAAALAGKHIFCEKPISFHVTETKGALNIVNEAGVKFQVGFNRRYDKHFRRVQECVQAGAIGAPHIIRVSSRDPEAPPLSYVERSGGMFMDMTIHDFDMVRYLSGSEVTEVSVKAANLVDSRIGEVGDVDTAIITLMLENGAIAVIDNSRQAAYGYDQRVEVFGSLGSVSADNERKTNVQISTKDTVTLDLPKHFFLDRYEQAYKDEVAEFATAILEDQPLRCTGEDGYKAELLALAAKQSWLENRPVAVKDVEVLEEHAKSE